MRKDDELVKLQKLLKDRKDLLARTSTLQYSKPHSVAPVAVSNEVVAYHTAKDMLYEQLEHEIKTIKVQLATMTEV